VPDIKPIGRFAKGSTAKFTYVPAPSCDELLGLVKSAPNYVELLGSVKPAPNCVELLTVEPWSGIDLDFMSFLSEPFEEGA
jgi:hypothetical protein